MIIFLCNSLAISIIGVMTVITSHFAFNFLFDLIPMTNTYIHNVNTMTDLFLSSIFLTPKVIMSGENSHHSYIITVIPRSSYNFGAALIQFYIHFLTHNSTIQYIYYLFIEILKTLLIAITLQTNISSQGIHKFIIWAQSTTNVQSLISILSLVSSRFYMW